MPPKERHESEEHAGRELDLESSEQGMRNQAPEL